jgi:asparagine synthase (glutamine-hydrolysing)
MCGIAGIVGYRALADSVDLAELRRMRDYMATRGPDGAGDWIAPDGRIGLAHRRLSIIDLSDHAAQPMQSSDGKLVITFNGEIYNHVALRAGLEAKGYSFRTNSDTEVLLQLYAAKGAAMVDDLRGMFAFAIWDVEKSGLFLARDPYGIKPLYFVDNGSTFRFASQVKAIHAGGSVARDPDPAAWVGFYLFGSIPEPLTTCRQIRSLPAGTTLRIDSNGAHQAIPYFNISKAFVFAEDNPIVLPPKGLRERVRGALIDSVRHHMVADVPVGIFLSAGIDSSALLGLMRDTGQKDIEAITLTYEEYRGAHRDEAPLAAKTAAQYGSRHHIRVVTEKEFRSDLPRIFDAMDQPTIDGLNTWFVSKAAKELGLKAVISGLGGDELFGGYPSFRDIPPWVRLWAWTSRLPLLRKLFHGILLGTPVTSLFGPKLAGLPKYANTYPGAYFVRRGLFMPWELDFVLDRDFVVEGLRSLDPVQHIADALIPQPHTGFGKIASLEASFYMRNQLLRDADWASMAHSLEVRVPLVDIELLRQVAPIMVSLPLGMGKQWLATSAKIPLPPEVINRRKTGFGTPINNWLERYEGLTKWRHIPQLAKPSCHWARRWAYQVAAL